MHIPLINMKKFVTITDILTMLHCGSEYLPEADLWWLNPVIPLLFCLWVAYIVNIQFWYDEGQSIVEGRHRFGIAYTDSFIEFKLLQTTDYRLYSLFMTNSFVLEYFCYYCNKSYRWQRKLFTNSVCATVNFLCETLRWVTDTALLITSVIDYTMALFSRVYSIWKKLQYF